MYHGIEGLRREFRRESKAGAETDLVNDRIDYGFTLLKWLNRGNLYAEKILDNLEVKLETPAFLVLVC